ncbi:MAG: hypothetical protein ACLP50_34055, partial [Solirubrobacteraceae bacterium]
MRQVAEGKYACGEARAGLPDPVETMRRVANGKHACGGARAGLPDSVETMRPVRGSKRKSAGSLSGLLLDVDAGPLAVGAQPLKPSATTLCAATNRLLDRRSAAIGQARAVLAIPRIAASAQAATPSRLPDPVQLDMRRRRFGARRRRVDE